MRILKAFFVFWLGWFATFNTGRGVQYHWDGNAATMPDEMNPPWTLSADAATSAYRLSDKDRTSGYLRSTQAVDNIYYEQRGARLQLSQPLIIQTVLRIGSGTTTTENRGPVGISFTVGENLGGSLWFHTNALLVSSAPEGMGSSTNLDTTTAYHTYRIEVGNFASGSPYTVYVDNKSTLQGVLFESAENFGPIPRIQWGDLSSEAYGESFWYSFSHNAAAAFTTMTNPAVELTCNSVSKPTVPAISAPFLALASEGKITDGTTAKYANFSLLFNTDNGIIYNVVQGGHTVLNAEPRRNFTQADGSQITLFEFTELTLQGIDVKITGSRAAAILATGNIRLVSAHIQIDAAGDPGAPARTEHDAGFDATAPLGGGGGRGVASAYSGGSPPFLVPSKLPTSGPGGGGFVTHGQAGFPAEPVQMWKYNGPPTFDFSLLGTLFRPGGEGGNTYTDFSVLRGGGGGGSSSGTGFAGNAGLPGGQGGGALLISTPGQILIDSKSSVSVDGQSFVGFLSEIAAGGAGGYLAMNADGGISNFGFLSARGGGGRKVAHGTPTTGYVPWWGSCGNGGGGLIFLKSQAGVTNSGSIQIRGDSAEDCTLGAVQVQTPEFVQNAPSLTLPLITTNKLTLSLPTSLNARYSLEYNDDLNTTHWITLTNLVGTGFPANILTPTTGVTNRFFRVLSQ